MAGLEPATPCFQNKYATKLRYTLINCNPITRNTWQPASYYVICSISPSQIATSDLLIAFETHRLARRRPTFTRHWNIVESISFAFSTPSFVLLIPISILISRLPGIQWRYALVLKLALWFYGSSRRIYCASIWQSYCRHVSDMTLLFSYAMHDF